MYETPPLLNPGSAQRRSQVSLVGGADRIPGGAEAPLAPRGYGPGSAPGGRWLDPWIKDKLHVVRASVWPAAFCNIDTFPVEGAMVVDAPSFGRKGNPWDWRLRVPVHRTNLLTMADVDIFVGNNTLIDPEVYQLWLNGYTGRIAIFLLDVLELLAQLNITGR